MPFDTKKKPQRPPGYTTHAQDLAFSRIENGVSDLVLTLIQVSSNHPEMQAIIQNIRQSAAAAARWVLEN